MGGGQAFLRAAESDLIISGFPALEVTICPHIAALWMVWQDGKLDAGELRELSAAHLYTEAQVLLYWHEVLEEIRVIPRVALRDHQGKILRRFHPLAMDTGAGLDEDSVAIKMTGFFSQWPSWVADENGFLALRGVDGALTVLSEVVPLFPPEWTVLLDRKLEQMRPRRVVVQTAIRMDDPRNNDLLSINLRFHCERLGLSESQLEAFIRGQQMWLVDGGQYIQVENIGQLRSLLRILLYRASAADEACNDMDSSAGGGDWSDAQRIAELLAWAKVQQAGSVRMEGALQALLLEHEADSAFPMPELPEKLLRTLRPWQRAGAGWLTLMARYGFGCVLADDMGLGKTLQMLAFLQGRQAASRRPSLLLCPKSLMFNWMQEARHFVPALRVLLVHGTAEERLRRIRSGLDADLVITTYPALPE